MDPFEVTREADVRSFLSSFVEFASTPGEEAAVVSWFEDRLAEWGFETLTWTADADVLAGHPSFPDDPGEIDVAERPSVAGVLEFGDPDAGRTLVLNGHVDVVPASEGSWSSPPFEATWDDDELIARGAADMKGGLTAVAFAARAAAERARERGIDGRIVVEGVAGSDDFETIEEYVVVIDENFIEGEVQSTSESSSGDEPRDGGLEDDAEESSDEDEVSDDE